MSELPPTQRFDPRTQYRIWTHAEHSDIPFGGEVWEQTDDFAAVGQDGAITLGCQSFNRAVEITRQSGLPTSHNTSKLDQMTEQARKLDEKRFWRFAAEAHADVERWPTWKQAAAGGVLRRPSSPEPGNKGDVTDAADLRIKKKQGLTMNPPINVRFDLVWKLTNMDGVELTRRALWQVPLVGEIVNIFGNPFRVIDVGWSLPNPDDEDLYCQYAYIKLQKASEFNVVIDGAVY